MKVIETHLKGCFVIEPTLFNDERGYFYESYNKDKFNELIGVDVNFSQDNQSKSSKGVLRGLHYQIADYAQAKLVRVIKGSVLDVCVDIREHSQTYGQSFSIVLTESNHKQLFVPRGFAHGFLVLEDETIFNYKCDNVYNKASERGIIYNDETLGIDWNYEGIGLIISDKDKALPSFKNTF